MAAQNAPGGPGYLQQQNQMAPQQPAPVPAMSGLTLDQIGKIINSPAFRAGSKLFQDR